jgi:hypothetical protein
MTREKGVSEWYQSIGLTCSSFPPNFYFFLGPHGPLNSKKRSLLQSSYMESCLAAHSVADPGCLFIPDPGFCFLPITNFTKLKIILFLKS